MLIRKFRKSCNPIPVVSEHNVNIYESRYPCLGFFPASTDEEETCRRCGGSISKSTGWSRLQKLVALGGSSLERDRTSYCCEQQLEAGDGAIDVPLDARVVSFFFLPERGGSKLPGPERLP